MRRCRHGVSVEPESLPDLERLLAAERHVQHLGPGAVLVGGNAAALHAAHRRSMDGAHVLEDLRSRFDEVLAALESAAGWQTARVQRPVPILGQMQGVLTGIRPLRRSEPLEVERVDGLTVPALPEMTRIQGGLLTTRYTVRDYLDTVVLCERLGEQGTRSAFSRFDERYRQPTGASPLVERVERLSASKPLDEVHVDLANDRQWTPSLHGALRWPLVKDSSLLRAVEHRRVRALVRWRRRRTQDLGAQGPSLP